MRETINGRTFASRPNRLKVNSTVASRPVTINGLMPLGVNINGFTRSILPTGAALYLPLHHPALAASPFKSLAPGSFSCTRVGALATPLGDYFDGVDDYDNCDAAVADGKLGGAWTLWCWGRLAKWNANQNPIGMGVMINTGYGGFDFSNTNQKYNARTRTVAVGENLVASSSTYTNDANWHFLAMTVDADGHINHFIVDAVDQGSDSTKTLDLSSHTHMYIGQLPYTVPNINPFKGTVDEVGLCTVELSVAVLRGIRLVTLWRHR